MHAVELPATAEAVCPTIAAAAGQIEQARRLVPKVLDALHEARLFRMLMPRAVGGLQVEPPVFLHVLERIGTADASTAWCIAQTSVCSMAAAQLPAEVAADMFGDPRAILAWGFGTPGRAEACRGGWRISGRWAFGSGGHHATWLGGTCDDAAGVSRMMLFPQACATFDAVWDVIGLRGTGSDSYDVAELFVPESHAFQFGTITQSAAALYRLPLDSLWAAGFASVALGVAQAMLDALIALAQAKQPRGATATLAASSATQGLVGQSDAALRAARCFLHDAVAAGWRQVADTGGITLAARMVIRQAASHAIRSARDVTETTYHAAGTDGVFATKPFERRVRDMHMISQHVHGRQQHFEVVGQFMLGLSPEPAFL